MSKMYVGRLPNGEWCKSYRIYVREWKKLTDPLNEFLRPIGYKVIGYDPGLLIVGGHNQRGPVDMPVDMAVAIIRQVRT